MFMIWHTIFYLLDNKTYTSWNEDYKQIVFLLQNGVLRFCGFQVLAPQIFWCPAHTPPVARNAMLEAWRERLNGVFAEKPLSFAPTEYFDLTFQGGFCLRPEVKEKYASESHGITTAQHLGKPLPPDNQTKAKQS